MSETVDVSTEPFSPATLREWASLCKSEMNVPPDMYDSDVQRAADELRLITAYRDMAIKAGEWSCKCGWIHPKGVVPTHSCFDKPCTNPPPCPQYRPEEL